MKDLIKQERKYFKMIERLSEKFTKYEIARILGARALQLAMDAPILLKVEKEKLEKMNYDVLKIAELELEDDVLPITVKRPFPEKKGEKIKKISKEEAKKIEEKKREEEEKKEKIVLEKEKKEEKEIKEEGEIMELAQPEDEKEETEEKTNEEAV